MLAFAIPAASAKTVAGCEVADKARAQVNETTNPAANPVYLWKVLQVAAVAEAVRLDRSGPVRPAALPDVFWIACAGEGVRCAVPGSAEVRYGADERSKYKRVSDSVLCSNEIFGDPARGNLKSCAYQPATPPVPVSARRIGDTVKRGETGNVTAIPPLIASNFDITPYLVKS